MSRFYSFPGMAPSQPEDHRGSGRLSLPDIHDEAHDAQFGEFLRSREATSHSTVGLDPGTKVHFRDAAGEDRPAIVLHEERDQHSGKVDVTFMANDQSGSGTYRATFEGDGPRSLKQSKLKRIHE